MWMSKGYKLLYRILLFDYMYAYHIFKPYQYDKTNRIVLKGIGKTYNNVLGLRSFPFQRFLENRSKDNDEMER